jgi:dTDP-4-amino-4,6-dideoxygalactose transaminase
MIEKYSWIDYGSSYVQSEILSALLLGQLEKHKEIKEKRRLIWQSYYNRLKPLQKAGFITLPYIPEESDPSWHLFFILVKNTYTRSELIAQLKSAQIESHFHYLPLHLSTIGRQLGGSPGDCPNSEIFSETLIRLPFYTEMELEHIETVCNHIEAYYEN